MVELFLSFMKVGLLAFGGGSAAAPLVHKQAVDKHGWITTEEFTDIVAISNSLPGPTMAQMAAVIGYKQKGLLGALIAVIGIIMPMVLVFTLVMVTLTNVLEPKVINTIAKPVLVVVAAMMISLAKKFFITSKKALNIYYVILVISITAAVLAFTNLPPSIFIVGMIFMVIIFTRGGKK